MGQLQAHINGAIKTALNKDAMANPGSLDWYVEFARKRS